MAETTSLSSGTDSSPAGDAAPSNPPRAAAGVLLVINRRARSGDSSLDDVITALSRDRVPPTILDLDEPGDLGARVAAELARGAPACVVVAGGDGTINGTLPAVLDAGVPLGVVPLGTANDLARTLGIPADPAEAARVAAEAHTRRIDVGRVNGIPFLNAAGIGFSAELADMSEGVKGVLGALAYPVGVLRRWRRHRAFRVVVRGAGVAESRRVIQVTVANGRSYGGGMTAHEDASIDDGLLDAVLVLRRPWWQLARALLSLKRGVYDPKSPIVALRGSSFEVVTPRPKPISTDGEVHTSTPAVFDVSHRTLEVCVPRDAAQG